jgi:hypothetical protein
MPDEKRHSAPKAVAAGKPALLHVSSSERGGWRVFGRLLSWATRNNIADEDVPRA